MLFKSQQTLEETKQIVAESVAESQRLQSELDRIKQAKSDLRTAIQNQGVIVPDDAKIDTYSAYVDGISTVRSVADVPPDDEGNVPLTIDDLNGLSDIKVVSTSTAESGTPASVEVVKSGSVANLSFIIPKGDDGEVYQQTYVGAEEPVDEKVVVWIDTSGDPTDPPTGIATLTFTGIVKETYNGGKAVTVNIPNNLSAYTNDVQFQTSEQVAAAINAAIGNALRGEY
jgi:hypothetical protein